ncbi:MAG: hypothetical protein IJZ10_07740 [Thermoguttaceae bacterium]|nr:hypothetical protein [Thermoguttaceae bacterium]
MEQNAVERLAPLPFEIALKPFGVRRVVVFRLLAVLRALFLRVVSFVRFRVKNRAQPPRKRGVERIRRPPRFGAR